MNPLGAPPAPTSAGWRRQGLLQRAENAQPQQGQQARPRQDSPSSRRWWARSLDACLIALSRTFWLSCARSPRRR